MLDAYNAGEAGKLKAERIEGELQEMRLNEKWKKACQHFLTTWEHKVLDLAKVDPDAVTEAKKWRWLRLAVLPHRTMEQAITNFDSIDKFARKINPDSGGLGFREMFNQLLDAATCHDKVAKDDAANQQRKVQQATTNASGNSKGMSSDKTNTTNGEGCWRYCSPDDWIKLPLEKKKAILEQRKKTPKPVSKVDAGQQSSNYDCHE